MGETTMPTDEAKHRAWDELEAGLDAIRRSPRDDGLLELIVRRPATEEREILEAGELDPAAGLVGDAWGLGRPQSPDTQLTIMNARAIALLAGDRGRWALAGDQLYAELDLSIDNLPPGTTLALGTAVIQVTEKPHLGCKKFSARFGAEALGFVNSDEGRRLRLRGMYAKVLRRGTVRVGDRLRKE
jgi:MOSC domain-containing protein YiiM